MTLQLRFIKIALWMLAVSLVVVGALPAISSAATPLFPGDSVANPGTVPPLFPPYYTAGPVPANYSVQVASTAFPYNYTGAPNAAFLGSVISSVYEDPATGDLAFSYKFDNLAPSPIAPITDIVRATIDDPSHPWEGVTIFDVGADGTGSSTPQGAGIGGPSWSNGDPYVIDRDSLFSGVDLQLRDQNRGTYLLSATNDTSATVWYATDATHYGITNVGLSDSGNTGSARAYAPAVPEPATWLLLAIGCCGLFLVRRRSVNGCALRHT